MDLAHIPIVVCGIAGKFPESNGLDEFSANLYNAFDMVTDCRRGWSPEVYNIPQRMGHLKDLDKFDADYFGVHGKQAENMDPRLRFLLEVSTECIFDSGLSVAEIAGLDVGVYVGASGEEGAECFKRRSENPSGYGLTGALMSTLANRLSFSLNLSGPSIAMDTACSSSLLALEQAVAAIRFGKCSSALVAGANLLLDPKTTLMFTNLGMTAADGKCKSFDSTANGYVRSEAAVAVYICKEEAAKRSYAIIIHANTNTDGYKENGITYPSGAMQEKLLRQTYAEAGVNPFDVGYIEAHGTGTQAGDFEEINAITRVLCTDRDPAKPLLIGSLKSNMGHSEPASGLCGIAKLVLIAQTRVIPGNLHYSTPNPKIPALLDGRIRVVSANTPFKGEIVAINSFGFGGTNVHVILKLPSEQTIPIWLSEIPVIMPLSGRTAEVASSLERLATTENKILAALLHNIACRDIPGHGYRSYAIVGDDTRAPRVYKSEDRIKKERRPLWFIFSGAGTYYENMGVDMMKMDAFRKSINKSVKIFKSKGLDPEKVLPSTNDIFNDVANSSVAIVAIQIALVDLLESVGIVPDNIVGHSLGEIPSAYADKCLSTEQALKLITIRLLAFRSAKPGAMASVGLSWDQALDQVPRDVFPACDNAADNVTVAGNAESINKFVLELRSKEIFAKQIQSSGMAYHSNHMSPCAEYIMEHLPSVIPDPKIRSSKWISTSLSETQNASSLSRFCSADYWINHALAPVRFREAIELIPPNAVVIEIGPHCVLQAILKRSLPSTAANIGVMSKKATNNCNFFLEALGKVYLSGHSPNFSALYENVKFPLGPSAPMISPVIRWDHSQSWIVPVAKETFADGSKIQICPTNESDSFYLDHIIDGHILFPGVGYMFLVWATFAKRHGKKVESCPVSFEEVRFERSTILSPEGITEFTVNIHPGSGDFEVFEGDSATCRGRIQELDSNYTSVHVDWDEFKATGTCCNIREEFYKMARLRGYGNQGVFSAIKNGCPSGEWAEIEWQRNWPGFIDSLLQLNLHFHEHGKLLLPIRIHKALFNPKVLLAFLDQDNGRNIPARSLKNFDTVIAPGIQFTGLKLAVTPRRQLLQVPKISAHRYLPFVNYNKDLLGFRECLGFLTEIAMDNTVGKHFTVVEFTHQYQEMVCSTVKDQFAWKFEAIEWIQVNDAPQQQVPDVRVISMADLKHQKQDIRPNLVIVSQQGISLAEELLDSKTFLLFVKPNAGGHQQSLSSYQLVAERQGLALYRPKIPLGGQLYKTIEAKSNQFEWIDAVKQECIQNEDSTTRLFLYSHSSISGLQGFVRCLRKEGYNQLRCFEVLDQGFVFDFDSPGPLLQEVTQMDLVYNVYSSSAWGCFTNVPVRESASNEVARVLGSETVLNITKPGDLSTLEWIESPLEVAGRGREHQLCKVSYSGLNFRDVMLATGKLSRDALRSDDVYDESILGIEYSGVLEDGTPVCGIQGGKCLATTVEIDDDSELMWNVPKNWTLAEAGTVPVAYGTAYYALVVKGKIREGETVLIHSGAGGVGQASISVALSRNCQVITTVSTEEKRAFLKARFSQLTDSSFADSRDPVAFEFHVMKVTHGRGVDVILNSLSRDSLKASLRCLAYSGRFLEIGKFDLFNNSELGLELFLRSVEFHGILVDYLTRKQLNIAALDERKMVKMLVGEGISTGVVKPLPYTEYDPGQVETAFRFMASGKHMGKILIKIRDTPRALPGIPAMPRTYFYPHKVYILVGGLGGMGLEIGTWMVDRGARNLVFVSRSGMRTWYQEKRVLGWRAKGLSITVSKCDVTSPDDVHSLLQAANGIGTIGGIFNLAVELKDALFVNQTSQHLELVSKPKIQATVLLDQFSRELATELDYFVVFSSVVCLKGNAGQSNYGYANSAIERICMQRRAAGLHGLAVQWGPIGDVGIYHDQTGGGEVPIVGCNPQRIASVLEVMDLVLKSSEAVVSSFVPESKSSKGESLGEKSLSELVARTLGVKDIANVKTEDTFADLGMDSLIGTELKQLLEAKLSISVPTSTIRSMTFAKLAKISSPASGYTKDENVSSPFFQTPLVLPTSTWIKMESQRVESSNLFLVHPVEGNVRMLEGLVKDLICNVFGFECAPDAPVASIPDLASHYIDSMKRVQAQGPYRLAGYSYGGSVACEMAIQLEKNGETVERLVLLDGSPQIPRMFLQTFSRNFKMEGEALWLLGFLTYHSPQNVPEVESQMMARTTWEDKLGFVADQLLQVYPTFSRDEIKGLGMRFAKRMKAGFNYFPEEKIRCEAVLIRAGQTGFNAIIGDDYGLGEICASDVKIIVVDGNHTCFCQEPTELNIAQIINDMLKNI